MQPEWVMNIKKEANQKAGCRLSRSYWAPDWLACSAGLKYIGKMPLEKEKGNLLKPPILVPPLYRSPLDVFSCSKLFFGLISTKKSAVPGIKWITILNEDKNPTSMLKGKNIEIETKQNKIWSFHIAFFPITNLTPHSLMPQDVFEQGFHPLYLPFFLVSVSSFQSLVYVIYLLVENIFFLLQSTFGSSMQKFFFSFYTNCFIFNV